MDNLINILEIYMNQLRFYTTDGNQAEKKALNFLILFAVLFNRHKLAKILWKRSEDPLPLALVCSLIYKNIIVLSDKNYDSIIQMRLNYYNISNKLTDLSLFYVLSLSLSLNN